MVKLDGAAEFPEAVRAIARAGIPVFAQIGITPQTAPRYGLEYDDMLKPGAQPPAAMTAQLVEEARHLEARRRLACSTSPSPARWQVPRS